VRTFKTKWLAKFTKKENISDKSLKAALTDARNGLIDADYGGGLIKQRVAREGEGKSGGYRMILVYRQDELAIFLFGFAKSDKANLTTDEVTSYKEAAKLWLKASTNQLDAAKDAGELKEIKDDKD